MLNAKSPLSNNTVSESASIGEVITLLESIEDISIEFDPALWRIIVEKVLVEKDDSVRFILVGGEEYQTTFGAPVPDNTITLTKKGVKEYLDLNGKGSEVSGWERINDNQYRLTVTIHELLGEKPLDDPIEQQIFYTLADGFLYEEFSPVELGALGSDNENYNINVYTRAK